MGHTENQKFRRGVGEGLAFRNYIAFISEDYHSGLELGT